jgi:hypothetical protein
LRTADALRLARQVASALAAAHERNVVHRDLKPANVMLVPDPEAEGRERAKILDFGLAKVDPRGDGALRPGTRTGVVLGTAMYMAPEQCRGARDVDGRADVYALGVILYEMLCGRPPFIGESEGELVSMQLRDEPPPLHTLLPDVPPEVEDVVHGMLTKDPAARPDMAQVVAQLEQLGQRDSRPVPMTALLPQPSGRTPLGPTVSDPLGPPGQVAPVAPEPDTRKEIRRHSPLRMAALGAAAVLALVGSMGLASRFLRPPAAAPARTEWQKVQSDTTYHLRAVWHDRAGTVWAVGDNGTILQRRAGAPWRSVPSGTTQSLRGIWGSGAADIWAVGGQGTILRWSGLAWTPVQTGSTAGLRGVWGSGPYQVWAVGEQGVILHWNGQRWEPVPSGVSEDFRAVWGSGPGDFWAVGEYGLLLHWDGSVWSEMARVDKDRRLTQSRLAKVWGLSGRTVWAVGNEGTVLFWDGVRWQQQPTPTREELSGIYGSGPADVWVVGNSGTLLHWDGKAWRAMPGGDSHVWHYGISGEGDDVWVVGTYGTLLQHVR